MKTTLNPNRKFADDALGSPGARPTRVRWRIAAWLTVLSALTYLDRLNLGIAGEYIQDEFAFSTVTMGWILSAFILGYAIFQLPCGWLGDRYGPRGVLTLAIVWWSVFTGATAIAPRLPLAGWLGVAWSFAVVRFLVGVGESATFPNANKIVAAWMGSALRAVGNSLPLAGIGLGGAVTPVLVAWVMHRWGWHSSFYLCSGLGLIVAAGWRLQATSRPEEHAEVNAAELELIRRGGTSKDPHRAAPPPSQARPPWRSMLSHVSVWSLVFSFFCIGYPAYVFFTWFFIYLVRVRGMTVMQGGVWGSTPFLAITFLAPLGGWVSDAAVARFGRKRGRQTAVWLGTFLSALLLISGSHTLNNTLAILLLAGSAGFNVFVMATCWAACIDLTPNFSGSLSGLMNTLGSLGGWLSPIVTAYIATHFGWSQALDFAGLVTLVAGVLWFFVNAEDNLEQGAGPPGH